MPALLRFEFTLSRRLLAWAGLSLLAGLALARSTVPFWAAFGFQALLWGAIDGLIALVGELSARRKASRGLEGEAARKESTFLSRLLWINTGLDVLYVLGGLVLALSLGAGSESWRGHGWGIVLQGGFLFLFDWQHALRVPPGPLLRELGVFKGSQHQDFLWEAGAPAALLVHGFPGSPGEMRPIARALHEAGWTVQGVLLPGFGEHLDTLGDQRFEDWQAAILTALAELRRTHSPLLLVGYSMGGALSILSAAQAQPDGLVLLAPFTWNDSLKLRLVAPLLSLILPRYFRPLRPGSLRNPQVRQAVGEFFPDLDLDDPEAQTALGQITIPLSLFGELRRVGVGAIAGATKVRCPVLIVQGSQDEVVRPEHTRELLERFPQPPEYLEVTAGHDIVGANINAASQVQAAVVQFAQALIPKS